MISPVSKPEVEVSCLRRLVISLCRHYLRVLAFSFYHSGKGRGSSFDPPLALASVCEPLDEAVGSILTVVDFALRLNPKASAVVGAGPGREDMLCLCGVSFLPC